MRNLSLWGAAGTEGGSDHSTSVEFPARPWSKVDRITLGVLIVSLFSALIWLVHPWYDPMNDASTYISSTRALIGGEGYSYLGMPFQVRPPGFSFLLAPLLATLGTNFQALNLYVAGFGCGVIVLLFFWARPQLGGFLALLVCYAVGLNPVFLRLCNQVMSDVPGTFFVLAALLIARSSERSPSMGREIALGICIALAAYVRVLGIMLLPAVLLDRVIRHARNPTSNQTWAQFAQRRCIPVFAVSVFLFAPWVIRNQLTVNEPPIDQLLNHSYATALFHYDKGDPNSPRISAQDWGLRVFERGSQITATLATRLQDSTPDASRFVLAAFILGIYLCWFIAAPSASGFFVILSLAITGSYFAFQDRLLLPIFVLLIPALSEAIHQWTGQRFGARWASGVVALLLIAVTVADFSPREGWPEIEASHNRMLKISETMKRELPMDARLATEHGFHYGMLMERPVYSLRWADRHAPGIAGIDAVIDRYRINTLFLDPEVWTDFRLEPGLVEQYGKGEWIAGVRVIRVRD